MAKLTAAARKAVPKAKFGVPSKAPGSGSYPMPDDNHARAALSMLHNAPASQRPGIRAKANKILGKKAQK